MANKCTNCGTKLDAVSQVDSEDGDPRDGDVSICLYCGHLMIFSDIGVRNLTDTEMIELAGNPELLNAMEFVRFYKEFVASKTT
jgi:hypothetical protein